MATYKTKAIVLSSFPYKEYDRVISFYTHEYGRIDARARGARKITSKLAGHLEPFIETELLLARGRRWDILAGSRTVTDFAQLRSDVEKVACAAVCAEATKLIAKPMAADARVYELLKNALHDIQRVGDHIHDYAYRYLWQLLDVSGFAPELAKCIVSRTAITQTGYFSFEGGGVLAERHKERDVYAVPIPMPEFHMLAEAVFPLSDAMRRIIIQFWNRVVDHAELRSWAFFQATV